MNADAIRHFFSYHFAENRTLWDTYVTQLTPEQFTQPVAYSVGSVRNHIVHLMSVDDSWFSGLRGFDIPKPLEPEDFQDRAAIRTYWDDVEVKMRDYLSTVTDEMLNQKPLGGVDADLLLWQVLLHVVNHGTDHRAQILRLLHDMGVNTTAQDYVFYMYDNP